MLETASSAPGNRGKTRPGALREGAPGRAGAGREGARTLKNPLRFDYGPADQLAAYYTEDRRMFLIPGLFQQPAPAARYAQKHPTHISRESLHRSTARCKLRLLQRTDGFQVRWVRGKDWSPGSAVWVAEPIECHIQEGR